MVSRNVRKIESVIIACVSREKYQAQVPPGDMAGVRNLEFKNHEVLKHSLNVIQVEFRVCGLEVIDRNITLQRPDRVRAPFRGHR